MAEVPWRQLVDFHTEIAKRMERGFFAFNPAEQGGDRWSSLDLKIGKDLAGPWRVRPEQINSKPFRTAARAKQHETLYLGGPCYKNSERVGSKWIDHWQPILYREVELRCDDEEWEIAPKEGDDA